MLMTLVKKFFIAPVSFLVSWWCLLLLACIALPVTVGFTSTIRSTFLPAMKKGRSATTTTVTRGRHHCHDLYLYNNFHRPQLCALLKMNKIANMQDAIDFTSTTRTRSYFFAGPGRCNLTQKWITDQYHYHKEKKKYSQ